jgi:uncharacterized protein YlxW (UPF0749 family)
MATTVKKIEELARNLQTDVKHLSKTMDDFRVDQKGYHEEIKAELRAMRK